MKVINESDEEKEYNLIFQRVSLRLQAHIRLEDISERTSEIAVGSNGWPR